MTMIPLEMCILSLAKSWLLTLFKEAKSAPKSRVIARPPVGVEFKDQRRIRWKMRLLDVGKFATENGVPMRALVDASRIQMQVQFYVVAVVTSDKWGKNGEEWLGQRHSKSGLIGEHKGNAIDFGQSIAVKRIDNLTAE